MGGPCGFRIPMTRPVCARGAPKGRPSMLAQTWFFKCKFMAIFHMHRFALLRWE